MSDPRYITDEGSEATDFERELLNAAQSVRLAPGEKQAIWAAIALAAAPTALSGVAAAGASASSKATLGLSPLLKGILIAVGVSSASVGGYWLSRSPEPAAPVPVTVVPAPAAAPPAPASEPAAATSSDVLVAVPSASTREAPAPVVRDATEPKSALRDESAAVLEVRRTLRAGDAGSALRLLEQARQRFPRGALGQEREALSIEALAKSGSRGAASQRAQAFLRAHPNSPYAADVQSFVSP